MIMDDDDGQMIFGDHVGLMLPDIYLTGEEKPSPRKLVPTGDRTRVRCVTDAHATVCSTAVGLKIGLTYFRLLTIFFLICYECSNPKFVIFGAFLIHHC